MKKIISLLLLTFVLFQACDRNRFYEEYKALGSESWHKDSLQNLTFEIQDSSQIFSLFVNIRNNGKYPYSNLILFVNTKLPGERNITDTLNCILADRKGKWLGSGFGSLYTSKIPYKHHIRFPNNGEYNITFQHGMRDEKLVGIADIGFRIEKVD